MIEYKGCDLLANYLFSNYSIQLIDLSNNNIGERGANNMIFNN